MIVTSVFWHNATSILFVTLVSSAVILSAALLLNRGVQRLSAAMRCRIWILSLMACLFPAMFIAIASVGDHDIRSYFGTPTAVERVAVNVQGGSEVSPQFNPAERSANEQATIVSSDFSAPAKRRAEAEFKVLDAALPESRADDRSNVISNTGLLPMSPNDDIESTRLGRRLTLSMEFCRAVVIGWMTITMMLIVRFIVNVVRSALIWQPRFSDWADDDLQSRRIIDSGDANGADFTGVAIRTSDAVRVPVVIGLFRPVVVLPTTAIEWSVSQLRLVLQHELAHIHRTDIAWNCLASLIRAVIWFQPLVWIVQQRLRDDQEFACDDAVLLRGNDAPEYAAILVRIAESVLHRRQCSVSSVAMANCNRVEHRIRSILDASRNRRESRWQRFAYLTGVTLVMLVVVFVSLAWTPELALANQDIDPAFRPVTTYDPAAILNPATGQPALNEKAPESDVGGGMYKFRHRVVDERGTAVAGAVVTISSRSFSVAPTTTDSEGWCELTVPSGSESAPTNFEIRAVSNNEEQIAIATCQLKGERLLVTGRGRVMPTSLQKVRVNDSQQKPIVDAVVGIVLGESIIGISKTDASGAASVRRLPEGGRVFALKDGAGFDFQTLSSLDISTGETEDITLTLAGARAITFRVVTPTEFTRAGSKSDRFPDVAIEGKNYVEKLEPLPGVCVLPEWLQRSEGSFRTSLFLDSTMMEAFCPKTNSAGEATIRWMPKFTSFMLPFGFHGTGICSEERTIKADEVDEIHQIVVDRLVEIQGSVVDGNGKPVAGSVVRASGQSWLSGRQLPFQKSLTSDAGGHFSMFVPPRQDLLLLAETPGEVSRTWLRAVLPLKSPMNVELSFGGLNQISGLVTSGADRRPLADRVINVSCVSRGEQFSEFIDAEHRNWGLVIESQIRTDEHGRYGLQVGDGEWQIENPFDNREQNSIVIKGGFQVQKDFHSDDKTLLRTKIVSAKTQQEERGTVDIYGVRGFSQTSDAALISRTPHLIEATSSSGKAFTVWDGQSDEFQILVAPIVTAHGQLVDKKGIPLANRSIRYMILPLVPDSAKLTKKHDYGNSGQISTDEQGRFTLTNFIQGCECQVMATNDEDKEWAKKQWQVLKSVVPNSDDAIELGQLAL